MFKEEDFVFEPVSENQNFNGYTGNCSNQGRSCCCTRSCTQNAVYANETDWGDFLSINGGVVQY